VAGPDAREGADILPDRVVNLADGEVSLESDPHGMDLTDLDNDDDAQASAGGDASDEDR
jgi:hypothetical protein